MHARTQAAVITKYIQTVRFSCREITKVFILCSIGPFGIRQFPSKVIIVGV